MRKLALKEEKERKTKEEKPFFYLLFRNPLYKTRILVGGLYN